MYISTWKNKRDQERNEKIKTIAGLVIVLIMYLLIAKYNAIQL